MLVDCGFLLWTESCPAAGVQETLRNSDLKTHFVLLCGGFLTVTKLVEMTKME